MDTNVGTLERMYERFNARDVDGVLIALSEDVTWANGMDGGHVRGHEALRDYWTRQWAQVRARVEPAHFDAEEDGSILAHVRQTIRDLDGRPLQGQEHGLTDRLVGHLFTFRDGKVVRFDIRDIE